MPSTSIWTQDLYISNEPCQKCDWKSGRWCIKRVYGQIILVRWCKWYNDNKGTLWELMIVYNQNASGIHVIK